MAWFRSAGNRSDEQDFARSSLATQTLFRLIAAYLQGVEKCVVHTSLAAIVDAALTLAQFEFALLQGKCSLAFSSECDHCIAQLEGLVVTLSTDQSLANIELAHAMDTLIALLLTVDAERSPTHLLAVRTSI
jgi:hypothetical protein